MPRGPLIPDSVVLDWLAQRSSGANCSEIAKTATTDKHTIRVATHRVLKADLEESGEPAASVRRAYW